jgi:hypothetical protein
MKRCVLGKNFKIPQRPVPTCLPRLGVVGSGNAQNVNHWSKPVAELFPFLIKKRPDEPGRFLILRFSFFASEFTPIQKIRCANDFV